MKQKLLVLLVILMSVFTQAQTSNIVSASEFEGIKINTATIAEVKKTKGKQAKIEALLGATTSYTVDKNSFYYYVKYNGLNIDFSTMKGKPYMEAFEINSNAANVTIKGITITIGDNISKLGNVVFSVGRTGTKSILYTECDDCDSFINIEFDQTSNTITKISYMDMS